MKDLLIKACCDTEYHDFDITYFVVELTQEKIEKYERYMEIFKQVQEKADVKAIHFWDDATLLGSNAEEILPAEYKDMEFIEFTDELQECESDDYLESIQLYIDVAHHIRWKGYGKHCSTCFWGGGISVEVLKQGHFQREVQNAG